ncbi:MAG: hypothetical protein ACE5H9_19015 [Anaerolineae bacterium]
MKPVICLKTDTTCRTPRGWEVQARYALLRGGQDVTLEAGAWLLDLGAFPVWTGGTEPEIEHRYRLANGRVVARDEPLAAEAVAPLEEPQIAAALNAIRSLEEAAAQDLGLAVEHICRSLPPFAPLKCPLCGGAEFTSLALASAWCDGCNAQFSLRPTAGDPGFVVDCAWRDYALADARYLLPRAERLWLTLVLKAGGGDPLDLNHQPEGRCRWAAQQGLCRTDAPYLTDEGSSLRSGLHRCAIGDLYDWSLNGRVPTPGELAQQAGLGWAIAGQWWPRCATHPTLALQPDERSLLESAASALVTEREEMANRLRQLANRSRQAPLVSQVSLPPLSDLEAGAYYLLYRWQVQEKEYRPGGSYLYAEPVWAIVRPVLAGNRRLTGWEVVREEDHG